MHNASDYQKCVEYCDKVIASKKLNHRVSANRYRTEDPADPYPSLSQGNETFTDLYVTQNAEESIFELQYNGVNNGNVALCQYYNHYSHIFMRLKSMPTEVASILPTTGWKILPLTGEDR